MGIYGALGTALTGLRVMQASIEVVGRNVANADTPGYTRKTREPSQLVSGDMVTGLRLGDVTRQINELVQRQYRIEASGAGYARTMSRFYSHIDTMMGEPGSPIGLDTLYNSFQHSLEELTVSPESFTARDQFLRDAQAMAQNINQMSRDIQGMRLEAERGLGDSVQRVNEILKNLETLNQQISSANQVNTPPADLLDKRDAYINELSQYVDIKVMERERGMVSVFTQSGALLLDLKASVLEFDERGTMSAQSAYGGSDAERGVGTIRLKTSEGLVIDLIQDRSIRSGELAALIDMRDTLLPQAQAQLDALADALARTMSAQAAPVAEATDGAQQGFDIDLDGMQSGDRFQVTYTVGGETRKVTVVRVDDPDSLPLGDDATADPDDTVIGVDFSGGMAAVAAQLAGELGPEIDVQATGGDTLRFLDDGAADTSSIASLSGTVTATSLTGQGLGIPLFVDSEGGGIPYTDSFDGARQQVGFAGRIRVNPALLADNSKLVVHEAGVATGDPARPVEMLRRLTEVATTYPGSLGMGSATAYSGTVGSFVQRVMSHQGALAADVERSRQAQDMVVAQLEERFTAESGVNIDQEMSRLIELQTAYTANTRVVSAVREMMDMILRM